MGIGEAGLYEEDQRGDESCPEAFMAWCGLCVYCIRETGVSPWRKQGACDGEDVENILGSVRGSMNKQGRDRRRVDVYDTDHLMEETVEFLLREEICQGRKSWREAALQQASYDSPEAHSFP